VSTAEYINNLRFFVKHGMLPGDGCDYIIVVQQAGQLSHAAIAAVTPTKNHIRSWTSAAALQDPAPIMTQVLPDLPANAHYKFHPNQCEHVLLLMQSISTLPKLGSLVYMATWSMTLCRAL
jgi:hypothetical protein